MIDGALYDPNEDDIGIPMPGATKVVDTPDQTVMMQAMMAQNPQIQPAMGQTQMPAPQAQPQPQGFLQTLNQGARDNSGLLMAAASGLGKGTPIGNMMGAVQDHFELQDKLKAKKDATDAMMKMNQAKLDETKRLNDGKIDGMTAKAIKDGTAKVTNVGNGMLAVTAPGAAAPTLMKSEDYQNFQMQKIERAGELNIIANGVKSDAAPLTSAQEQHGLDLRKTAEATDATMARYQSAMDEIKTKGAPGFMALPGMQQIGQIFGTDSSIVLRHLNELKVDAAFSGRAVNQGAISNFEREMLLSDIPAPTADMGNWLEYMNARMKAMAKLQAFSHKEADDFANKPRIGVSSAQAAVAERRADPAINPQAAPATMQAYPKTFNPPNNGRSNPLDTLKILTDERAAKAAEPDTPARAQDLAALDREIARATPGTRPGAAPGLAAATAPKPAAAAAPGVLKFSSGAEAKAAFAAGKLKKGDTFIDEHGKTRKVN